MSATSRQQPAQGAEGETREPEEIRADIAQTREELGETAAAVAEKADVVGNVKQQASAMAEDARNFAEERPLVVVGAALVAVVVLGRLLSR